MRRPSVLFAVAGGSAPVSAASPGRPRVPHPAAELLTTEGKWLRGTKFDPFGHTQVRRIERQLLAQYVAIVTRLAAELDSANYDRARQVAGLADLVRGYEEVKLVSIEAYHARLDELGVRR